MTGREDAINYATCEFLWETGVTPGAKTAVMARPAQYTVWEAQAESMAASQDQINGNLNWIGITIKWRYNGGCVTDFLTESAVFFPGVNWKIDNKNNGYYSYCTQAVGDTNAIFEDDHFCPNPVYNIFDDAALGGHWDGTAVANAAWRVPPNCAVEHLKVQSWYDYRDRFIHH